MAWTDPDSFVTRLFSGDPFAIVISFLVTLALPALLHWYFYTTSAKAGALAPTFLLLGPSGAGKTSLATLLQSRFADPENAEASQTRMSQEAWTLSAFLPTTIPLGSNKYRSENDFETVNASKNPTRYLVVDTPGHGKLRNDHALSKVANPALKGVVFMVDSTTLEDVGSDSTRDAATYLHDTLLAIQRRKTGVNKVKGDVRVLIAANKQDLFTALPAGAIKERLQSEVEKVKSSKRKGISSVDADPDADVEDDVLGGGGEDPFSFNLLEEEYNIVIQCLGGAVKGEKGAKGIKKWEEWIGGCL